MTLAEVIRKHGKTLHAFGVALYAFIEANPGSTYDDARKQLGMGRSTVLDYAARLESLGLISREARANDKGIPLPTLLHTANNTVQHADSSKDARASDNAVNNTVQLMDTVQQPDSVQHMDGVGETDPTKDPANATVQHTDGSKQYRPPTRRRNRPPHPHKEYKNTSSNSQPSAEGGADAPPQRQAKPFDPRIKHPAIEAVRMFIHCLPDEQNRDEVIEALGAEPDKARLAECYRVWKKQGWNKVSLVPATDWYVNGIPDKLTGARPEKGGGGERHTNGHGPRTATILQYDYSDFGEGESGAGAGGGAGEVPDFSELEPAGAGRPQSTGRRVAGGARR